MVTLNVQMPGKRPVSARLENAAYLIGSAADCHLRLPRPEISSHHAQLIVHGSRVQIMDLGSSNGTLVDSNPLYPHEPYDVRPGARITIGKVILELAAEEVPAA